MGCWSSSEDLAVVLFFFSSRRRHTRCALVTGVQTCALPIYLTDVLLDPASEAMRTMRSRGLPTTLFFDAQGRQVDMHLGEITMPSLKDKMSRRFDLPSESSTDK